MQMCVEVLTLNFEMIFVCWHLEVVVSSICIIMEAISLTKTHPSGAFEHQDWLVVQAPGLTSYSNTRIGQAPTLHHGITRQSYRPLL